MRVSVALCTYRGEAYLAEQLASILGQTRTPDELVLSDDASDDGTVALARRMLMGASFDVVVIENPESLGVTANFAQALRATTGDLVLLCDQDDVWPRDRVATIETDLASTDALLRHSDARLVDAHGELLGRTLFERLRVRSDERRAIADGDAFAVYLRRNLATGAATALRRELLELADPFPSEWVHDEWLAILAAASSRIRLVDSPELDYRQHGANQIGVAEPTLRYRLSRVVDDSGARAAGLARRSAVLADRLELLGFDTQAAAARAKSRFEERRSRLPGSRLARIPGIARGLVSGEYRRFASQRSLDAVRDLFRPA